ncbi:MAG TPA: type II toxin-antitoxin system HicB family antitoxin [Spirochaetia bacterium]|nr:type II toxin-antitoxin system HicB family antitoxin [Spirochaetia bacterium]
MQRFAVIVEQSDDEYFAYVPALPGCTSGGKTLGETIENVKEAIRLTLDYMMENGLMQPQRVEMVAEVVV